MLRFLQELPLGPLQSSMFPLMSLFFSGLKQNLFKQLAFLMAFPLSEESNLPSFAES